MNVFIFASVWAEADTVQNISNASKKRRVMVGSFRQQRYAKIANFLVNFVIRHSALGIVEEFVIWGMDQTKLGIGTRLQHTRMGPGVIVGVRYACYLISFLNVGIKEVEKTDPDLDEIQPENVTAEVETVSEVESSLLRILRLWGGITEPVALGDRWQNGTMILQPADKTLKGKDIPIEDFFHKIVMLRDRLRVLEQNINSSKNLSDEEKVNMQQYITRCYGSLTTFNVLFKDKEDWFVGEKKGES
ncbi:MAG: hypothetical protein WBP58_10425 [Chitinophagaceae bacterium]